jgi:predicted metal-dependent HD superfamily phosphohydrolase
MSDSGDDTIPPLTLAPHEREAQRCVPELVGLPVVARALTELRQGLSPQLYYHSYEHTLDVVWEAVRFAIFDGLAPRARELLAVAAAFHDTGFLLTPLRNEPHGAALAQRAMEESGGYSAAEIGAVHQMILDTALQSTPSGLRQIPHTELSPYLLDADLSNLGRPDFFERGELQRREVQAERTSFWRATLTLLEGHTWLTPAGTALRQEQQLKNTAWLRGVVDGFGFAG